MSKYDMEKLIEKYSKQMIKAFINEVNAELEDVSTDEIVDYAVNNIDKFKLVKYLKENEVSLEYVTLNVNMEDEDK